MSSNYRNTSLDAVGSKSSGKSGRHQHSCVLLHHFHPERSARNNSIIPFHIPHSPFCFRFVRSGAWQLPDQNGCQGAAERVPPAALQFSDPLPHPRLQEVAGLTHKATLTRRYIIGRAELDWSVHLMTTLTTLWCNVHSSSTNVFLDLMSQPPL